jgi:hypothetical protein
MTMIRGTRAMGAVGAGTAVLLSVAACSGPGGTPPSGLGILGVLLVLIGVSGTLVVTVLAGWALSAMLAGLWRLVSGDPKPPRARSFGHRVGARLAGRTAASAAVPPDPPGHEAVWRRAHERFQRVRAEYAAYECDPVRVLRLPALADVSVASTARFVEAFAEAQALETGTCPEPEHARRFTAVADQVAGCWTAARDAAERIRFSGLGPVERGAVQRVIKLLTTARDSDSEPERLVAYARARSELAELDRAGVVHLPGPARVALDAAARGQLPGPEPGRGA